jgi:hypothetical protein
LLAAQATELVRHFYAAFQQVGQGAHLPTRALDQATGLIARRGYERARFVVDYAHRDYERARPADRPGVRAFGWVLGYENQAVSVYDRECQAADRSRVQETRQQGREDHEARFRAAYHAYLEDWLAGRLETQQPDDWQAFRDFEETRRRNLADGPAAGTPRCREHLRRFEDPGERLERFRVFLRHRAERRQRVPGVLAFWEWDRQENAECFDLKRSDYAAAGNGQQQ